MRNLGLCICITFWALCAGEDKRAPSGFTALRGRRSDSDEVSGDLSDKKTFFGLSELAEERPYDNWEAADALGLYKRAPTGFFGLRGKKDVNFLVGDGMKRRPPSGFVGMRGKKLFDDFEGPFDKRTTSSRFWGMRGKREYDSLFDVKRAPENRFFGMRGKRQQIRNGDFGKRGVSENLSRKFIGVRGKKSAELSNSEYFDDELDRYEDVGLDQLMFLLSQNGRN